MPIADRRLDRLQPEAERDAVRVGDAVRDERDRDRDLDGADVPRPERDDRRHVHHQQDERGRRHALVDVERAHRRVDREQLADPSEHLEEDRARRRQRPVHDGEALAAPS